jgi:hypothetical protein
MLVATRVDPRIPAIVASVLSMIFSTIRSSNYYSSFRSDCQVFLFLLNRNNAKATAVGVEVTRYRVSRVPQNRDNFTALIDAIEIEYSKEAHVRFLLVFSETS